MAELVVALALFVVGQDLVGLGRLLEPLFGTGVVGIAVRVVFHGQPSVRLLDVRFVSSTVDAENLVVVTFGHGPSASIR